MNILTETSRISCNIIIGAGVAVDPAKIEAITKWPNLTNLTKLRIFFCELLISQVTARGLSKTVV
jgi:hypothetical protein